MTESKKQYLANCGWQSNLENFIGTQGDIILARLHDFPGPSGPQQDESWKKSIGWLKAEYSLAVEEETAKYHHQTLLEFELPRDFRRPDVLLLKGTTVVVLEVKGAIGSRQAALDQVSGYARDLKNYHSACRNREVISILVPTNGPLEPEQYDSVWVVGPKGVHRLLQQLSRTGDNAEPDIDSFMVKDAYAPLPTIVQAARDLYHGRELPFIKRARAATEPAIDEVSKISHEAARKTTRHLVLVSGVPGAGKTLVGLQVVHAGWLEDLAVDRDGEPTSTAAVYLSGNGPLVAVLQDALKGGDIPGTVFVQDIKKYVSYYSRGNRVPPEHVIVFDEAQRAHDADRVAQVHKAPVGPSEPEHLIEFCTRIPEWSVLVGLIGSGQAIHVGEEGGMELWRDALVNSGAGASWTVHAPKQFKDLFTQAGVAFQPSDALNLDTELRFHLAPKLEEFVEGVLEGSDANELQLIADHIFANGCRFLVTRDLEVAKRYVGERYEGAPNARYGILASSKDKWLPKYNVDNTFQTTKRLKVGPWYNQPKEDLQSCCQLNTVATEFSSQGLELDFVILAWGSDLLWDSQEWSIQHSRGSRGVVHDPIQLRKNVYRVLLTRGRDGTIVFVPPDPRLDLTYERLCGAGFRPL